MYIQKTVTKINPCYYLLQITKTLSVLIDLVPFKYRQTMSQNLIQEGMILYSEVFNINSRLGNCRVWSYVLVLDEPCR